MITPDQVRDAIIELFKKKSDVKLSFAIAPILHKDVAAGQWSVSFSTPPPKMGKELKVGLRTFLISSEPPNKCRLCHKIGHNSWDCTEETCLWTLGDVATRGTVGVKDETPMEA